VHEVGGRGLVREGAGAAEGERSRAKAVHHFLSGTAPVSDVQELEGAPPKPKRTRSPDLRQRTGRAGTPDNMTRDGAERLAAKLNSYWHEHGYPAARHWVEPGGVPGREAYVVRSNLCDGLPPPPHPARHQREDTTAKTIEHDAAGRRISLATVKELTGCMTQEQVFNRVRAGRLPRPISLSPMWFDEAAVRDAIASDPRMQNSRSEAPHHAETDGMMQSGLAMDGEIA